MPEIGTYPLFSNLVDDDSFLGVSSVDGKTYRGSVAQISQKLIDSNTATQQDISTFLNEGRLMTLERSRQLITDFYCLPRRVIMQDIFYTVPNVTVNMTGHLNNANDMWIMFRNVRFNYTTAATATIQLDISYDGGLTYPTNNHAYQASVTVANAITHGGGVDVPVVLLPGLTIGNPVVLNMVVRVTGSFDTSSIRMYEWRGSVRYFNTTTRVGPFWGSYTTTGNQPRPTHLRLSSTGGQSITNAYVTAYRSPSFI